MYYRDELDRMLKDERNIVNRMYLNEIAIQLNKFEKVLQQSPENDVFFESLADKLNNFTKHLDNPKYLYNKATKNGFKKSSPIHSSIYLDDIVESFFLNQPIVKNKGVKWGKQAFSMNLAFSPSNLGDMERDLNYNSKLSPIFLQLTQKIDLQYRVSGKRVFQKMEAVLPLISFFCCKSLNEEEMIRVRYYADKAKQSLSRSRFIVVCETLNQDVLDELGCSGIDVFFVLRKQRTEKKNLHISQEVLRSLYKKINEYLYSNENDRDSYRTKGYID